MSADWTKRAILITGGNSGIGQAAARALLERGAKVVVAGRDPATSQETVRGFSNGFVLSADIADADAAQALVKQAQERIGVLDGLVTSAAVSPKVKLAAETSEQWDNAFNVNVRSVFLIARAFLAQAPHGAAVVTLSSTAGVGHIGGLSAGYHASKAAVISLTRYLALEAASQGVRVNSVAPGLTRTPMTQFVRDLVGEQTFSNALPFGRILEPHETAAEILHLLSPESSSVTGTVIPADGGVLAIAQGRLL
jgi:NAD(P)-dependent dehydrogenase (short-subunit alcohol dehydrogenase family)